MNVPFAVWLAIYESYDCTCHVCMTFLPFNDPEIVKGFFFLNEQKVSQFNLCSFSSQAGLKPTGALSQSHTWGAFRNVTL